MSSPPRLPMPVRDSARRSLSGCLAALGVLLLSVSAAPVASADTWDTLHTEMRDALASLSKEYFASGAAQRIEQRAAREGGYRHPWMIVVGLTGGMEGKDSAASGVVALNNLLNGGSSFTESGVLPLTYNNFHWQQAVSEVVEVVRAAQRDVDSLPGIHQPLIVIHGHSWGANSIVKMARELQKHKLEISLAIFIDSFSWQNPRLPPNIRYAVNFYQRAGILRGLPMRGSSKLAPEDPNATEILGNYRITPQTTRWGWSWNPLQPLFYRQHHLIAHDFRLKKYLQDLVGLKLNVLERSQDAERHGGPPKLFRRVAILGASVSSSEKAPSPGDLLARQMGTPEDSILVIAEGGAESSRHLEELDNISRFRPTLIVALDLFFHDFKLSLFLTESRQKYLRHYIARLHETGAVVVIGNIPPQVLLRHEHVNRFLEGLKAEFPRLIVIDVRGLMEAAEEGLHISEGGEERVYRREDLMADRVHPNELGSALVANIILKQLKERFPQQCGACQPVQQPPARPAAPRNIRGAAIGAVFSPSAG